MKIFQFAILFQILISGKLFAQGDSVKIGFLAEGSRLILSDGTKKTLTKVETVQILSFDKKRSEVILKDNSIAKVLDINKTGIVYDLQTKPGNGQPKKPSAGPPLPPIVNPIVSGPKKPGGSNPPPIAPILHISTAELNKLLIENNINPADKDKKLNAITKKINQNN